MCSLGDDEALAHWGLSCNGKNVIHIYIKHLYAFLCIYIYIYIYIYTRICEKLTCKSVHCIS